MKNKKFTSINLFVIIAFMLLNHHANCQIKKGSLILSGNMDFSYSHSEENYINAGISPSTRYFMQIILA